MISRLGAGLPRNICQHGGERWERYTCTSSGLDGVIDAPTWTFDYGFHPKMGEAIGAVTERSQGILLGRTTYEMFEPAWSKRTVEDDPGAPFFNGDQVRRLRDAHDRDVEELGDHRAVRPRRDPKPEGRGGRPLRQQQRRLVRAMPQTAWSTSCISPSTRSTAGPARGSSPRARRPPLSRSRPASRTRTVSSTWPTDRRHEVAADEVSGRPSGEVSRRARSRPARRRAGPCQRRRPTPGRRLSHAAKAASRQSG